MGQDNSLMQALSYLLVGRIAMNIGTPYIDLPGIVGPAVYIVGVVFAFYGLVLYLNRLFLWWWPKLRDLFKDE